ncbi:hypothetical protein RIF29_14781 [Crotalaria pallida]|uniref:Uncharacterized protein n=1 Tax=Crotalaria pallida TaxID=3830 RepID=A0AAN9FG39_CROPI
MRRFRDQRTYLLSLKFVRVMSPQLLVQEEEGQMYPRSVWFPWSSRKRNVKREQAEGPSAWFRVCGHIERQRWRLDACRRCTMRVSYLN